MAAQRTARTVPASGQLVNVQAAEDIPLGDELEARSVEPQGCSCTVPPPSATARERARQRHQCDASSRARGYRRRAVADAGTQPPFGSGRHSRLPMSRPEHHNVAPGAVWSAAPTDQHHRLRRAGGRDRWSHVRPSRHRPVGRPDHGMRGVRPGMADGRAPVGRARPAPRLTSSGAWRLRVPRSRTPLSQGSATGRSAASLSWPRRRRALAAASSGERKWVR